MTSTHSDTLAALEPSCSRAEAEALYDRLPAVQCEDILGGYRGRELATGHPMDGMLQASGWYGKQFDSVDAVHPLVFATKSGDLFSVDPRRVPLQLATRLPDALIGRGRALMSLGRPLISTSVPRARLRMIEYRGVVTAAMVYDHLPIIDAFRRVDERTLLGMMDLRDAEPYFFILERTG